MRPSCWSSRQASVGATAIVHLNLPMSLPNSRPSCSSMSGAASPPAPQRSQARTYPIASASRIVRPNPKVRLCADSSSVRMKAAGGVPLRRDAPCPNTGPPVNLEFGIEPYRLVSTSPLEASAPTLQRRVLAAIRTASEVLQLRRTPANKSVKSERAVEPNENHSMLD
jgi:hypothetical protein